MSYLMKCKPHSWNKRLHSNSYFTLKVQKQASNKNKLFSSDSANAPEMQLFYLKNLGCVLQLQND